MQTTELYAVMGQKILLGACIILCSAVAYVVGLVSGFNNGIEYQQERTKEELEKHLPLTEVENPKIHIEMD